MFCLFKFLIVPILVPSSYLLLFYIIYIFVDVFACDIQMNFLLDMKFLLSNQEPCLNAVHQYLIQFITIKSYFNEVSSRQNNFNAKFKTLNPKILCQQIYVYLEDWIIKRKTPISHFKSAYSNSNLKGLISNINC